ncbi:hypothetical protein Sango_2097900 [Sesamum angolense]|uniref:Retrotransposon gag protein n=1 Tax=Sesamum angolense TaxID=2727404 RepID=A0AAE1WBX2_9LAMI|nr:hypothetical protein Sango_2097900 [Sesamum angolense]
MDTQEKVVKSVKFKLTISKSSNSSTKSIGITTRNMLKKLKESSQMSPLAEYVEKNLHSPSYASENLTRAIEGLMKHVQEQDAQITRLINKADNIDLSHVMGKQVDSCGQLKEFIEATIRSKIEGSSRSSFTYSKPYNPRIDCLKMPMGYQPPKFQQFDGKGNAKQHVTHFVETCNNAGTYDDHLVKQFVRSLRGNAFDWYIGLEAGSINGWEQLEQEFLNRFYNAR